jgi:hypothetical protein
LSKTKICPTVEKGSVCENFGSCPFAHNIEELRATPMLFRTVICSWWQRGGCEFGSSCRFAHGEEELRIESEVCSNSSELVSSTLPPDMITTPDIPASFESLPTPAPEDHPDYIRVYNASLDAIDQNMYSGSLTFFQRSSIARAAAIAAIDSLVSPLSSPMISPSPPGGGLIEAELNKLKKGFQSSPALMTFLAAYEDAAGVTQTRQRADSDPGDFLLQELEKLWSEPHPLIRSDPYLSASHMTLENYQIHDD